jgi:hypothetical protein
MLEEALALLREGYSVIPIDRNTKQAAIEWAKFQTEKATEEDVRNWFKLNFNVGIVTGKISNIVVVDIDPVRGGNLQDWLKEYPTDYVVETGSGGAHCYYEYPENTENVRNLVDFKPGYDLRADGGYVIAPGSIHPRTKLPYKFLSKGFKSKFNSINDIDLRRDESDSSDRGSWLSTLLGEGASEGNRNDSLTKLSGYFAGKGVPQDVALEIVKIWNNNNELPTDLKELETTVKSVYKTEARKKLTPKVGDKDEGFAFMPLEEFMTKFAEHEMTWTVQDWLPDQTIAMVVAPPESYKTWLLLDLAVSVASGEPFLGMFPVVNQGPVLIIQQEDFAGQTAQRLEVVRYNKLHQDAPQLDDEDMVLSIPQTLPIYLHPDRKLKFDDPKALAGLEAGIKELKPALIIIDPLYSTGETDDYMTSTVQNMFALKDLRDKYKCSFVLAHHTNKSGSGDKDRQRAWGSQFLNAFLETGWQIYKETATGIKVNRHFKSAQAGQEIFLTFDIDTVTAFKYQVVQGITDKKLPKPPKEEDTAPIKPDKKPKEDPRAPIVLPPQEDAPKVPKRRQYIGDDVRILIYMRDKDQAYTVKQLAEYLRLDKKEVNVHIAKLLGDKRIKSYVDTSTGVPDNRYYYADSKTFKPPTN